MSGLFRNILRQLVVVAFCQNLAAAPLVPPAEQDFRVKDQNGKEQLFFKDLLQDRYAFVQFFYSSCEAVCPLQAQRFQQLKSRLGDRLGRDVLLLSITLDAKIDQEAQIAAWAKHHKVDGAWFVLGGQAEELKALTEALLGEVPSKAGHSPFLLVGRKGGPWKRLFGLMPIDAVIQAIPPGKNP